MNNNDLNELNLMNSLYDLYGELLTPKQQKVFESYYFYNLSLSEIAENLEVSKAAVLDNLEHSKENLIKFENSIHLFEKISKIERMKIDEDIKNKVLEELKK